jgi:multidrug resistance efflux pump
MPGIVSSVEVRPGQRVAEGTPLVSFRSREETVSLERIQREFELLRVLRDPSDEAARQTLTSLRAERELAEARQQARTLRAPHEGVVTGLRIRPGQYVTPGESVVSVVGDKVDVSLVELDGFHHEYHGFVMPGTHRRAGPSR